MRFLCNVCDDSVWVWCIISACHIYMCVSPDVGVQVTWMSVGGDFPMSIPHTVYIVPEGSFLRPAPLLPRLPVRVMAHISKIQQRISLHSMDCVN